MQELIAACIALEHVGDVASGNMVAHVRRKHDRGLSFSPEGWQGLVERHDLLLTDARLAFNGIVSRDQNTALVLVRAKERFREAERRATAQHFGRLKDRGIHSIDTLSLHLDTICDLKQINSLLATLAYPILEEQGLLASSRLCVSDSGTACRTPGTRLFGDGERLHLGRLFPAQHRRRLPEGDRHNHQHLDPWLERGSCQQASRGGRQGVRPDLPLGRHPSEP